MIKKIHKIHWDKRWTSSGKDIDLTITDVDCFVTEVSHPCAKWAIGEAWHRVCDWFENKYAVVTLGEPQEENNINNNITKNQL